MQAPSMPPFVWLDLLADAVNQHPTMIGVALIVTMEAALVYIFRRVIP